MPQVMTMKERGAIAVKAHEYFKVGNMAEVERIGREELPLAPYLAKFIKSHLGADFLIKGKYNLSEVEAELGPDWITQ